MAWMFIGAEWKSLDVCLIFVACDDESSNIIFAVFRFVVFVA